MLRRLTEIAHDLGLTEFTATYYADNTAIRRLLRRSGHVAATGFEQGEGFAVLDISAPDSISVPSEPRPTAA